MSRGNFWSRRKAAVEAEAQEEETRAVEAEIAEERAELEEKSDAEVLEELGLPDPDTLEPGQDIAGFMQKHVPERLRQRALRQLWRLNPVLANLDGLCDYNDDFTNAATDAPGVATAYKVGKGMLKHIEALEEQAAAKAAEKDANTPEILSETQDDGTNSEISENNAAESEALQADADAATAATTKVEDNAEYPDSIPSDTTEPDTARPRRMRFRIESDTG